MNQASTSSPSRSHHTIRAIAEIAIFSALGYVLDLFAGMYSSGLFPNGGSLGIAMVCVFLIAYRWGLWQGIVTGLIMGLLDIADGFYVISGANWWNAFAQVALDYWIAYPLAGFAGVFAKLVKKNVGNKRKMLLFATLGCVLGGALKYLSHVASGAIFWGADSSTFAWKFQGSDINPWAYSLVYNIAYMGPDIVLSTLVVDVLLGVWPKAIIRGDEEEMAESHSSRQVSISSWATLCAGTAIFVTNLVVYLITAIQGYYDDGYGKSILYGQRTILVLAIFGLLLLGYGIYEVIKDKKGQDTKEARRIVFASLSLIWGVYALTRTVGYGMDESFNAPLFTFELLSAFFSLGGVVLLVWAFVSALKKNEKLATSLAFAGENCLWVALAIHGFGFGIMGAIQSEYIGVTIAEFITGAVALLLWVVTLIKRPQKQA